MDERIIVVSLCVAVAICLGTVWAHIRSTRAAAVSVSHMAELAQAVENSPTLNPPPTPPEPVITDDDTIRSLSSRLAALEGMLPNLKSQLDGVQALAGRVAALEQEIPGLADAWERFSDAMDRKDKRDGQRQNRQTKKEVQLAGDAAQEFLGPLGSGNGAPGVTPPGVPPSTNGPTRNIVGKGRTKRVK